MKFNWKKHNHFTFTKEQVVRLAGWYHANKENGHGFSTALLFALAPAAKNEDAIWPNATIEMAPSIVGLLETIQKVDEGKRKIWWVRVPSKTNSPNEPIYISYAMENWIRKGLQLSRDRELEKPVKFVPDFVLKIP